MKLKIGSCDKDFRVLEDKENHFKQALMVMPQYWKHIPTIAHCMEIKSALKQSTKLLSNVIMAGMLDTAMLRCVSRNRRLLKRCEDA